MEVNSKLRVFLSFIGSLSLLVASWAILVNYMDMEGTGWAGAILLSMAFPFFIISGCCVIHFIYALFRKRKMGLWEKILVPLFSLLFLLYSLPMTPSNYCVSSYNPKLRMVTYLPDVEAWRGGWTYAFRNDSVVECRVGFGGFNGELKDSFCYSRRGDSLFFMNDTFFIEGDHLLRGERRLEAGYIDFDKDKD